MAKVPTSWLGNPSAEVNRYVYNSASFTYNSAVQTYSGVVVGDQADTEKTPTVWSAA